MKNTTFHAVRGFSLVELMIALALGLFLTGVAITVVINNRQTFRLAENQARMQENARAAFEMMARDLRAAGGKCERSHECDAARLKVHGDHASTRTSRIMPASM